MSCLAILSRRTRYCSNSNRCAGPPRSPALQKGICMSASSNQVENIPGIQFVDHVAIAVKQGDLDNQVKAYTMLGFREIHREEVHGTDQVREALLQIGDGPNLIQLLEPLSPDSPVQKIIEKNGGRPGVAHVAFRVQNAQRAFDAMQNSGF